MAATTSKRKNWSKDPYLRTVVDNWFNKTGLKFDKNGEEITSLYVYANVVNIPVYTLQKYCHRDETKCRKIGAQCGRRPLLQQEAQQFLAEVAARKDRANNGLATQEMYEFIKELEPELTPKQARDHYNR